MQVPVYPDDIKTHSFKRLAKTLQKKWPGLQPIQLSAAQELLAKGLGYLSFHDLMKKVENPPTNPEIPALAVIQIRISEATREKLNDDDVSPEAIASFASNLPFYVLSAYYSQAQATHAPQPKLNTTKSLLSSRQLETLVGHVKKQGGLRDNALMDFIVAGARSNQFLRLQRKHLTISATSLIVKTSHFAWTFPIQSSISRLASQRGADPAAFLFPSKDSNSRSMSSSEFNKLYKTWLKGCHLDARITPHSARLAIIKSVIENKSLDKDKIKRMIGHTLPPSILAIYKSVGINDA